MLYQIQKYKKISYGPYVLYKKIKKNSSYIVWNKRIKIKNDQNPKYISTYQNY